MATDTTPKKPKVFRIKRFQIGLNVLVQILAVVFILGMLNYMAFNHYRRWDFSRDQKFALSDQTKRLLRSLDKPMKVIVFFNPVTDVYGDLQSLLKEYQYTARKKLEVETVDPYRNFTRARDLQAKYKFGANENVVILDYDGRTKFVNAPDMADYDQSGMMYGQPPRLKAFKGEQALTSGMLQVTENAQSKLYVLAGKGGPDLKGDDLATFKTYLERQNIKFDSIDLMNVDKVPEDAKAIFVLGARYDLSGRELQMLREFWDKKGRLFIALDPTAQTPKLAGFLTELGVTPQNDRIIRTVALGPVTGIMREVVGVFSEASEVTKRLKGVETMFMGQTQSVAIDQSAASKAGVNAAPLITAAEGFWGETNYENMQQTGVAFDPKEDHAAPLPVAVSVEKGGVADQRVRVDSSRIVVVGNAAFVTNDALTEANVDFALSSLNWLLSREELIGITPKEAKQFTLNLRDEQVRNIALMTVGAIPAVVALFGIASWVQRRR
ncbi:MAG: gliding motility-associatede transport system auxiliary component [Chthoniobacter sp.]|jgi:hypothetical protein|nr:gliding motility-associatede transport system auxiliary component [Chthoniobacter sp.]